MTITYENDIIAWANEQAFLLRSGNFSTLDIQHIAEEIEDVGKSEQREIANRMAVLIAHLLKWQYQIECKSSLSIDDVNEHLERLEKLKRLLPAQANKQLIGTVTGMVIPDNAAQYAYRQGLYVIGQTGDHLVVRNNEKFKAKVW